MSKTSAEQSGESPEALLSQVALGNRAAFEALYRATADRLFGICLRVLRDRAEAEEVLQEVFTAVWRKAAQYDPRQGSVMSWLGITTRNRAIDRLRTRPARASLGALEAAAEVADAGTSPAEEAEASSERERLSRCLEELEPRRRSLIRDAFFGGLTYEELATRVQAPLGSVKSWVRRGLLQLRACLEP
ncbi:MAG TPA: sigma-70 family RNA polymerase sigma factor [Steroidobacteraceae bacterium]|nr:sigma-70 family RNA polymerase sigma factor [Gammaproteobacteria bacterium]HEV2285165.1 sigma-70 family RNA polymerase sigma factor [Steroidobacteraceae bacterium]